MVLAVDRSSFRYVGNTVTGGTPVTRVLGFRGLIQDQNGSTNASFTFVIRPEDPASPGQPDPSAEVVRTAPVPLPPSGPGPVVFDITATLATAFEDSSLPTSTWFFGAGLPANPVWTADGLSVHMASYYGLGPLFPMGHDNPRPGAPGITWFVDTTNTLVGQAGTERTHHLHVLTDAAVLNSGQDVVAAAQTGPNPSFGVGGIYPDNRARTPNRGGVGDGLALRVRHAANLGGMALLCLSPRFAPPGGHTNLPGFRGTVPLPPIMAVDLPMGMAPLVANGRHVEAVIRTPALAPGMLAGVSGTVVWAAVTVDAAMGNPTISNAAATHLE